MHPRAGIGAAIVALLGFAVATRAQEAPRPQAAGFKRDVRPLLETYCFRCHGAEKPKANVNLAAFEDEAALQRTPKLWQKVLLQLRERVMPPEGKPQPTLAERERLVQFIEGALERIDYSKLPPDPGRVLIRRLSRTEYNNTIRDLLGVDTRPADKFPADGSGGAGFDNNAETLFVPPILMEKYLEAAGDVLDRADPKRLFTGPPGRETARIIIERFATLAFRRPVGKEDLARFMAFYDKVGGDFERAVKIVLKAILVSPRFLFRIEEDKPLNEPWPADDYELASRLSYFLWSSMPDAELLDKASRKALSDPKVLEEQVRRMIQDPKSRTLADEFAGQWLGVRNLHTAAQPDPGRFPGFTPSLRDAMIAEAVEFFHSLLRGNATLLDVVDADYTFLNEELAKHYGIAGVKGSEMRRVKLPDRARGGVLTMGGVLTLTSYPQRTSPVLRGKWVLEEILGAPPPPPLPNAGGLPADDAPKNGQTFRQRLELHRSKSQCAGCHSRMDPLGFGLENFDAIGRWRTEIGGAPVDASGELAGGGKFTGPAELKKLLLGRKEAVVRNLVEKMLSYALGRGLEHYDVPAVRAICAALAKNDYRTSSLIAEVAKSYPFRYRRNPETKK